MNHERIKNSLVLLFQTMVFLLVVIFFYLPLISGYFSADDISWIWFAATKSVGEMFFSPLDYRAISSNNFTSMLGLSFKIDWHLFGMEPEGYFVHTMLATLAAGSALLLFTGLYTDKLTALAGFNLFFLNPIVLSVTGWNATRHYMEGLLFALLALYFFIRKDRTGKVSFASSVFYLLSLLCKEVYAVLPLLALLISRGDIKGRLLRILPMAVSLLVYTPWRLWMLGGVGGYPFDNTTPSTNALVVLWNVLTAFSLSLFHSQFALPLTVILIAVVTAKKSILIKPGVLCILLFLPLLPVVGLIESHYVWSRYFFHISVFLVIVFVLWTRTNIVREDWRKIAAIIISVVVTGLFILRDVEIKKVLREESMAAKSAAAAYIAGDQKYIKQTQPAWFYDGLHDMYEYCYRRTLDTKVVPTDILLPYLSDQKKQEISEAGYQLSEQGETFLGEDVLKGSIEVRGYEFRWTFSSHANGRFYIAKGRESGLYHYFYPLKAQGTYQFGRYFPDEKPEVFYLKVIYQSSAGWDALSREYRIVIPGDLRIQL